MSKTPALSFNFAIKTEKPQICPGVVNTGEKFDVTLTITANAGNFQHKGIDFDFYSEYAPKGAKAVKFGQVHTKCAEAGTIASTAEFTLPTCKIPARAQTYMGESFTVRHWMKVHVRKTFGSVEHSEEVISYVVTPMAKKGVPLDPVGVRVAVADNIRIDLMINRSKFDLNDLICGGCHFLLVALKIKTFTISLIAQEMSEVSGKTKKNKMVCESWDITDGPPVKGEIIPFRLYLAPLNLSPSCANAEQGYSVAHFLHFSFVTLTGEKYFKSVQINLVKWSNPPFEFE